MSKPTLKMLSPQDWATLFTGSSGAHLKLNSSTNYTVENKQGVEIEITGTKLKATNFFGLHILSGGTITGFDVFKKGKRIAIGSHYDLKGSSFYNAVFHYLLSGAKTALFDLFLNAGESISGSWKTIESGLSSFRLHNTITEIRLTSGKASVSTSVFAHDKAALDKIVGGFQVYGGASTVKSTLESLTDDVKKISAIAVTKGKLSVGVSTFGKDRAILDKVIGGFALEGSVRAVKGDLKAMEADAEHIDAIKLSKGAIDVSSATLARDHKILDKIVGGFEVSASVKAIESDLKTLKWDADHGHLAGLEVAGKGTPTFHLTAAEAKGDAKLLKAIHGGYVVDVHSKTGTLTTARGNHLIIDDVAGQDKIWASGADERFVFSSGFGDATISGASDHLTGKTHDTFAVQKSEFSSFAALLHDLETAHQSGHAVVIDGKHGDKLTLENVTLAELRHAKSDFAFI